jgi:hypothetical protein
VVKEPTQLQLCSVCRCVAYCCLKCQEESWPTHKKVCNNIKKKAWNEKVKLVCSTIQLARLELQRRCHTNQGGTGKKDKQKQMMTGKMTNTPPIHEKEEITANQEKQMIKPPASQEKQMINPLPIEEKQMMTGEMTKRPAVQEKQGHDISHNSIASDDENPSSESADSLVFAKFISFPYWPAQVVSKEGSGVNVQFPDGSTSGLGGAVRHDKILPFNKKSAEAIIKMTKFKSGHHSLKEFKKDCLKFGLEI